MLGLFIHYCALLASVMSEIDLLMSCRLKYVVIEVY